MRVLGHLCRVPVLHVGANNGHMIGTRSPPNNKRDPSRRRGALLGASVHGHAD